MAPPKRKTGGSSTSSRTTPKGTRPGEGQKYANPSRNKEGVATSSRYTPPVPAEVKLPKPWVPWLMLALLGVGMVILILKNLVWSDSTWLVLVGLGCILGGLYTATKWR